MASEAEGRRSHLDAQGDREVVFCHQCSNEWYRDEDGLQCPSCHCDFCEIITPDNDPRDMRADSPADDFPDPEEDLIDLPSYSPFDFNTAPRPSARNGDDPGARGPGDPNNGSEVFARFQENLNMFMGGPRSPGRNRFAPDFMFSNPAPATQTRTYISPGGRAAFSITTSTGGPARGNMNHHAHDDFGMLFGNVMGTGSMRPANVGQPGLEAGLQGLFSILLGPGLAGPNAVHGDVVYTQEALDRIITQLMDNNPQSNAAPPASESALERLQKKKLDKEMLGDSNKAECTICIDELNVGDEITVLPCKHWFHGECVVLWLKEHNTCPICRASIEKQDGNGDHGPSAGNSGSGSPASDGRRGSRSRRASDGPQASSYASIFGGGGGGGGGVGGSWNDGDGAVDNPSGDNSSSFHQQHHHQTRGIRSPEERAARLNAIRGIAGPMSYGQPQPGNSSPIRPRRDSRSPISPPPPGTGSARERSPSRPRTGRVGSSSWGRSQGSGDNNNTTTAISGTTAAAAAARSPGNSRGGGEEGGRSSNLLGWIRDRFHGGGSGGSQGRTQTRRRS